MRILLLAPQPFYQNRGTPIAVRLLAETLGRAGHEVHLLVFHEGENIAMENVTIHRIPALPGLGNIGPGFSVKKIISDLLLWFSSLKLHRQNRFDVVHAVEEAVFPARLNRIVFQVPYIYDMDSCLSDQLLAKLFWLRPLRGLFEWFETGAIRRSVGVVAVCRALEDKVVQAAPDKPLVRLEDISLLDTCSEPEVRESLKEQLSITGKIVLYIGNLEKYQGIDLLLESFHRLGDRQAEAALVIIGGSSADISRYERKAEEMGLGGRVFFAGPRPLAQLAFFLEQADILVSPRIEGENTPMKIYSYLDSGRPVVATRIVSHTQVMDDDISVLVEPEPDRFADALDRLLRNEELGRLLAERARAKVARFHSRPVFEEKLLDFYRRIDERLKAT